MNTKKEPLALWAVSSIVFLLLFSVAAAFIYLQAASFRRSFLNHAQQHAVMVSEVIQLNARSALASQFSIENLLTGLLSNTARFLSFLDNLEPFSAEELAVLSKQNGLSGITILRPSKENVSGPDAWLPSNLPFLNKKNAALNHLPDDALYILSWQDTAAPGSIVMGFPDRQVSIMKERLGIGNLLKTIEAVPGIVYVKMEAIAGNDPPGCSKTPLILSYQGRDVAEACQKVDSSRLKVGLDAGYLTRSIRQLHLNFFLFSFLFAVTGLGLSWFLHRYQSSNIAKVRQYERKLAAQKEAAALGKSAAAIAHEIRNPLNSLSMGLQRLDLETEALDPEHKKLIHQMLEAIKRANTSVTSLLNYAGPKKPGFKETAIDTLVENILNLFSARCAEQHITITKLTKITPAIETDPEILAQVVENIVKNAVEAQPDGGFVHWGLFKDKEMILLTFKNNGCTVPPEKAHEIFDAYFTTRVDGTGLGMAIVKRAVASLGGSTALCIKEFGTIETTVRLPVNGKDL